MDNANSDALADVEKLNLDFEKFIAEVYEGQKPYKWQTRLLDDVLKLGSWPDTLAAPTGSGKTFVIEIHLFLNAMAGLSCAPQEIPRRLVITVNRRALVDDQYDHAQTLYSKMLQCATANPSGMAATVWDGLGKRSDPFSEISTQDHNGFGILSLRGGEDQKHVSKTDWRAQPTRVMVICATPDMFGSRLLFRGYGLSKAARPLEAGLLAYDTVAMIDEAHLNRQLLKTVRQIKRLESLSSVGISVAPLQVIASTATQPENASCRSIQVEADDFVTDISLEKRLTNPKPIEMYHVDGKLEEHKNIRFFADKCEDMRTQVNGTIGCIVNSVSSAMWLEKELSARVGSEHVVCIVGRMRPFDRASISREKPGIFDARGNPSVNYLVGTQTLEVGLDIDLCGLVTELASCSAIAQRCGRVNRFGKRQNGPICIIAPSDNRSPYSDDELKDAESWIDRLPDDAGISPWIVVSQEYKPVEPENKRVVYERLELWDADYFSATSEELSSESVLPIRYPEKVEEYASGLELWLRDEFSEETDAFVIVRANLPADDDKALRVLELLPPITMEKFPVSVNALKLVLRDYLSGKSELKDKTPRAFLIRPDDPIETFIERDVWKIRPGDTIVFDDYAPLFLNEVLHPDGHDTAKDVYDLVFNTRDDVSMPIEFDIPPFDNDTTVAESRNRLDQIVQELVEFGFLQAQDLPVENINESFISWLKMVSKNSGTLYGVDTAKIQSVINGISNEDFTVDCVLKGESFEDGYFIVFDPKASQSDCYHQEISTHSKDFVTLESHCNEVSMRARSIAKALGLPDNLTTALSDAGELHDEGKRDERFQGMLRLNDRKAMMDESMILAKSRSRSFLREMKYRRECDLQCWRHEQRSAVVAWTSVFEDEHQRTLVTRLVGTNHGHGRNTFEEGGNRVLPDMVSVSDAMREGARELYDVGLWERIIEETSAEYGYWGVSYLEALLRAADVQISSEGK